MIVAKQRMLWLISLLIISGFLITAWFSFYISQKAAIETLVESELPLTSDNVFSEVQRDLLKPEVVSSFMAHDTFLIDWVLAGEQDIAAITKYLNEIKRKYSAFTAFFVSDLTQNYYYADGILKQVSPNEQRDRWYYRVREMESGSEINLDPDMANQDALTIFINFKVRSKQGEYIGATGLGLKLADIRNVLAKYRDKYGHNVFFVTPQGSLLLHSELQPEQQNIRTKQGISAIAEELLSQPQGKFRYQADGVAYRLNSRLIEELNLILVVEAPEQSYWAAPLRTPLLINFMVCVLVITLVLWLLLLTLKRYQGELERVAWKDPLTGLLNRRAFLHGYKAVESRIVRSGNPAALLMIDIDHFKRINDSVGHNLGDKVLTRVAEVMSERVRPSDLLGRWGGDEFLMVLNESTEQQAVEVAERIRQEIVECPDLLDLIKSRVTLSIGITMLTEAESLERYLYQVDNALYQAKEQGRNCSCCYSGE